jgi:D-erythro-7,8-dihydroneopterin triphosphate epimerase
MSQKFSIQKTTVTIRNLALRTIIGFNEWERDKQQDVIINVDLDFDSADAVASDAVERTLDYKQIKRSIIELVEQSRYHLLEALAHAIVSKIMENEQVLGARVMVDKPHALRFADSVAITIQAKRDQ